MRLKRFFMVGIELVAHKGNRIPFPTTARVGYKIAQMCRHHGLLIRPIGNIVILLPPLNTPVPELQRMVNIVTEACRTLGENLIEEG